MWSGSLTQCSKKLWNIYIKQITYQTYGTMLMVSVNLLYFGSNDHKNEAIIEWMKHLSLFLSICIFLDVIFYEDICTKKSTDTSQCIFRYCHPLTNIFFKDKNKKSDFIYRLFSLLAAYLPTRYTYFWHVPGLGENIF